MDVRVLGRLLERALEFFLARPADCPAAGRLRRAGRWLRRRGFGSSCLIGSCHRCSCSPRSRSSATSASVARIARCHARTCNPNVFDAEPRRGAVRDPAGELPAGRIDVFASRRRMVTITAVVACSSSRNRSIASCARAAILRAGERIERNQIDLGRSTGKSRASARACAGESLTPSSITYSNVTLRPFCSSR